jgi:sulfide:quinone oxidoreductase
VWRLQEEITHIDTSRKRLIGRGHKIDYESLIIATGLQPDWTKICGLRQGSYNMCDMADITQLREALQDIRKGTVLITSAADACPTPYEYALLARYILNQRSTKKPEDRKVDDNTKVILALPDSHAFPHSASEIMQARLADSRVLFLPKYEMVHVDHKAKSVIFKNGQKLRYNVLVSFPPQQTVPVLVDSGIADKQGRVFTNAITCKTEFPGVYCIGDAAHLTLPDVGKLNIPKLGVVAVNQGDAVAEDLIRRIETHRAESKWDSSVGCEVSPLATVITEVGFRQALRIDMTLFKGDGVDYRVSEPDKRHLVNLATWWTSLDKAWFGEDEDAPEEV